MESMLGTIVAAILLVGAVEGAHVAYVESQDTKARQEVALHQERPREAEAQPQMLSKASTHCSSRLSALPVLRRSMQVSMAVDIQKI